MTSILPRDREVSFSGNLKSTEHGPEVSALHGNLLGIPNLSSQPNPLTWNLHFNAVPRGSACTLNFEKHWFKDAVQSVLFSSIDIHEHPLYVLKSMSAQDVKGASMWGYNNHKG